MNATPGTPKEKYTAMVLKNKNSKVLFLSLLVFLTLAATGVANAQNSASSKWNSLKLPKVYQTKLDDFLANNNVMKDEGTNAFTKDFVSKEMETDWSISKENQLLFIWHAIYKQVTDKDLYDGQDGDQKIAEDFNNRGVNIRIRACGQKYRNRALAYMNQRSAEAQQRSDEARQQSAESNLELFTKSINDYNDFINKNKNFIDKYAVEDAYLIINKYKIRVGELQKRHENLRVALQNNQRLSAHEAESLKEQSAQLLSEIKEQRAAMFKQRLVVVEKNYAATEKKIAETQQKILGAETVNDEILQKLNEAKEAIVKAKQNIDKAKTNNSENSLISAEYNLVSAEARQQSAEARQQSAEARQQSINALNKALDGVIDFYNSYQISPDPTRLESFKPKVKELISRCKGLNIDYKSKLSPEMLKFYGVE